jgi:Dolichyl-phosphate-mannose-protein mannosyltransferase
MFLASTPGIRKVIAALLAGALAAATLRTITDQPTAHQYAILGACILLLTAAFPQSSPLNVTVALPAVTSGWRLATSILLIAAGCGLAAVAAWNGYAVYDNLFYGGFEQYIAGGVCVAIGLTLLSTWPDHSMLGRARQAVGMHAVEMSVVAPILLFGFFLRIYRLASFPPALGFPITDEPQIGGGAINTLHYNGHPWQYPELVYSAIASFRFFGVSMATLRYPSAVISCVLLVAFYFYARMYFHWPVAAVGTALLAVSHWDLAYSRDVIPATWMMVYELLIFLLAARAARGQGTYAAYAVMGVLTGMGAYSHASFRLVPLLLIVWTVGWLIVNRRSVVTLLRVHAPGWALYLVMALLVAWPFVGVARNNTTMAFTERFTSILPVVFNRGSVPDPGGLVKSNMQLIAGFFFGLGDTWGAVDPIGTPMLDLFTGTLFALGLGYAVLHFWRPHLLMWLIWLLITLITGALLTVDFAAERFLGALPVIFLLACIPLQLCYDAIVSWRQALRWAAVVVLIPLLCLSGISNIRAYFVSLPDNSNFQHVYYTPTADMLGYFRPRADNSFNYLLADLTFPAQLSDYGWLAGEPQGRNAANLADLLPMHDAVTGQAVNVMVSDPYPTAEIANAIRLVYPHVSEQQWWNRFHDQAYAGLTIAAADVIAAQGLDGPCPRPAPCMPATAPASTGKFSRHAFWSGSLFVPVAGYYHVSQTGPQETAARVVVEGKDIAQGAQLLSGWCTIVVDLIGAAAETTPHLVWTGPNVSGDVPANYLRKTAAHGLVLQFLSTPPAFSPIVPAARVPFPYFVLSPNENGGRPPTPDGGYAFRAMLTGIVAPGHAGRYLVAAATFGGTMSVFLDGRRAAMPVAGIPGSMDGHAVVASTFTLALDGRPQVLQIQYDTRSTQNQFSGIALYRVLRDGTHTFFPWEWLSPPANQTLLSWIPG